jgi:maltooligosyl trehalose synthase (EC 5.4.99.15)
MVSVPNATYRLQLTESFTLNDAAALVPYLQRLGISHVYLSPILRARSGSTHGYDVVDPNQIDPRLGGEEGWAQLRAALTEAGMGAILDFVPNHMGIGKADNDWWLDVLEWGMASPYARFFDIDWHRPEGRARPVLVLPILGKPYGEALRDGESS